MAIVYTWDVVQLDTYPEKDGFTDVVFAAHWTLSGTNGSYTGYVYGTANITLNEDGDYTPYADLTQAQVVGWVKNSLGEENVLTIEAGVSQQIANQVNPPTVSPPLPWQENTN